jgi:hypothetical protein
MGRIGSLQISVQNYHSSLRNIPEEARSNIAVNSFECGLLKVHNCMTQFTLINLDESDRLKSCHYTNCISIVCLRPASEEKLGNKKYCHFYYAVRFPNTFPASTRFLSLRPNTPPLVRLSCLLLALYSISQFF